MSPTSYQTAPPRETDTIGWAAVGQALSSCSDFCHATPSYGGVFLHSSDFDSGFKLYCLSDSRDGSLWESLEQPSQCDLDSDQWFSFRYDDHRFLDGSRRGLRGFFFAVKR